MHPSSPDPDLPPPTADDQLVAVESDLDTVAAALDAIDADDLEQADSLTESLRDVAGSDEQGTAGAPG